MAKVDPFFTLSNIKNILDENNSYFIIIVARVEQTNS